MNEIAKDTKKSALNVAEGFIKIANENMANAIKKISVQKGYDISDYALSCFGGAGGQHACAVADLLRIKKVIIHPFAGVLSAFGMGLAEVTSNHQHQIEQPVDESITPLLQNVISSLSADVKTKLIKQNILAKDIKISCKGHLKYKNSDNTIETPISDFKFMKANFEKAHKEQFGFVMQKTDIILEFLEVEASGGATQTQKFNPSPKKKLP